ncbi:unnamed protein product, partial [Iphiclides podalirius]
MEHRERSPAKNRYVLAGVTDKKRTDAFKYLILGDFNFEDEGKGSFNKGAEKHPVDLTSTFPTERESSAPRWHNFAWLDGGALHSSAALAEARPTTDARGEIAEGIAFIRPVDASENEL